MGNYLPKPHGGKLVNRVLDSTQIENMRDVDELPKITVDKETWTDIRNIAEGVFSPLEGFMGQEDFLNVVHEGRLSNGTPWTIPIVLDVHKDICSSLVEGSEAVLIAETEQPIALFSVSEIYNFDREDTSNHVFGTKDVSHPGVQNIFDMEEFLVGGKIELINNPPNRFEEHHMSPIETREIFEKRKWKTVAGFQTRNVPHLGHEYVQKTALTLVDGIFINPIMGKKKKGDFKDEVILTTYQALIKNYFIEDNTILGILQTEMRYAGPREAIFHAIIRKNFGCTHFIVGRDHAGVGNFYHPFAAHDIFKEFPDLEITPIFFPSVFFCDVCKSITNDKACPHSHKCRQNFSGTKMREAIQTGVMDNLPVRPEVTEILLHWKDPLVT